MAPAPVADPAQVADDLVEGGVDETVELDLGDRPGPGDGHPNGGADDPRLVERGVDHPVLAEPLLEALGDPEDAAGEPDVLAEQHRLGRRSIASGMAALIASAIVQRSVGPSGSGASTGGSPISVKVASSPRAPRGG